MSGFKMAAMAIASTAASLLTSAAYADSDLEKLAKKGFGAIEITNVDGEYQGCEYGKQIELLNGLIFQCSTYNYHYAYSPEVIILQSLHNKELRVLIDEEEIEGQLYRRK
ncbi:hypothetical protein [Rhizobium mesoamericanum]|uniref:hypothetical protein n=1 Tax=Rhizobium mesoamericanum TaxID=1079800 RepID=UPI000405A67C|nr:hypothetical protein [Rhizobium mesoamericanum]